MNLYNVPLTDWEIQIIIQMFAWGQLEINRQMKRLGRCDFDLKDYYWGYRDGSNDIKNKLKQIRGY